MAAVVRNPSAATVSELTTTVVWPNDNIRVGPGDGVAGFSGILQAGGFLVPPKTVGAVSFIELDPQGRFVSSTNVSVNDGNALLSGWFYHRGLLKDVDGDGLVDVIAARATKPLFGTAAGELVWMRQPAVAAPLAPANVPWQEIVLIK